MAETHLSCNRIPRIYLDDSAFKGVAHTSPQLKSGLCITYLFQRGQHVKRKNSQVYEGKNLVSAASAS